MHHEGDGSRATVKRGGAARAVVFGVPFLLSLACAACIHQMAPGRTSPGAAPSPEVPWTPPAGAVAPPPAPAPAPAIPPDLLANASNWGLAELVDLALRNSPDTRVAWARARAAAADLGAQRGAYYPTAVFQTNASKTRGSAVGGQFTFETASYNPYLTLNYLLFDFGGRKGAVEESRQALISANWSHGAVLQDQVLKVEQAYFQYVYARALEQAEQASLKEAQGSLDAATRRHDAGLSTIADVLQARTRLSQAQLALETVQGQIQTIHGVLATAIGLPANTRFEVETPVNDLPLQEAAAEVERAIEEAQARRPDLAAARADALKAEAHERTVRSLGLPSFASTFNAGRIYYSPSGLHQDTWSGSVLLTIPVFNGMTWQYNRLKAQEQREEARARLDSLQQEITYQVWSSYYNLQTAAQKVATSKDLIDSARQSYEVISARYKAGVGSILDLLTATSDLESARAQEAQARTDWFLSMAQLAHDTGTLSPPGAGTTKGNP
ncbi:MAG: TolC family protein [Acidobacteria bacterium]|nr:MAG: TolC family protein [Acidobacteriota bacterium]